MDRIDRFDGEYRFLSNFYPCYIEYGGVSYNSSEAAYQAQKTLNKKARLIFSNLNPAESKVMGKEIRLRDDWERVKVGLMQDIVFLKFSENEFLKAKLLDTGNTELIEGNWWNDTFWGVCGGVGENHLGKILMKVRDRLNEVR